MSSAAPKQSASAASRPAPQPSGGMRRVASSELFGEAAALVIVHNGREYLLRVTQNGKLILTA